MTRASDLLGATTMAKKAAPVPTGMHTMTPYLCVRDSLKAIAFYKKAFGAIAHGEPLVGPDGKIGHAQIQIGDSVLMLSDEMPAWGNKSPETLGGTTVKLHLYVADADAAFAKAIAAGATVVMPVMDQFYGDRSGRLTDPFGYGWIISTHTEDVSEPELKRRFEDFTKNLPDMAAKGGKAPAAKGAAGASGKKSSAKGK
jgi:PhnB protein